MTPPVGACLGKCRASNKLSVGRTSRDGECFTRSDQSGPEVDLVLTGGKRSAAPGCRPTTIALRQERWKAQPRSKLQSSNAKIHQPSIFKTDASSDVVMSQVTRFCHQSNHLPRQDWVPVQTWARGDVLASPGSTSRIDIATGLTAGRKTLEVWILGLL